MFVTAEQNVKSKFSAVTVCNHLYPMSAHKQSEFRLTEHVYGTNGVCFDGLDGIVHVMRR